MDQFREVVEKLEEGLEKIGLYVQSTNIMTDSDELAGQDTDSDIDVLDLMNQGEAHFALAVYALIGDLAFDQRIVNPDGFKTDQDFKALVPEEDIQMQSMLESMASWRSELDTDNDEE